jgi:hypothetical protein
VKGSPALCVSGIYLRRFFGRLQDQIHNLHATSECGMVQHGHSVLIGLAYTSPIEDVFPNTLNVSVAARRKNRIRVQIAHQHTSQEHA